MKKLFLSIIVISGISYFGKPAYSEDAKPAPAADKGTTVYETKCASCHAKTGKGNPAMAKIFKVELAALDLSSKAVQDKKDEEISAITTNGKGKMPAYKDKLSKSDIDSLTAHIRSLAKK